MFSFLSFYLRLRECSGVYVCIISNFLPGMASSEAWVDVLSFDFYFL